MTDERRALALAKRAALAFQRYDWEQGVVAQAFLEAGDADTAHALAAAAAHRISEDGRCARMGGAGVTDPCSVGEALWDACEKTGDPALIHARDALLRWALEGAPRSESGVVYHLVGSREFWVDSMYMLPPFLARAGRFDEALRQLDGWWAALYLPEKGLLAHRYDDAAGTFIRRDAWGVGNGWALAGMARVIGLLPPERAADRVRLIDRTRSLLAAVMAHQRPDGRFHDVLDDPDTFPEVNCGQMAAWTIYRGVREGWLEDGWLEKAERSRAAALAAVDDFGFVRDVCGLPDFDRPGVAPEGQAFFVMMEGERGELGIRD